MRFDTSQHMKLGQQMKLAPRMIQSMEILQMPLADLQERIELELENNPTLELKENEPEGGVEAVEIAADGPMEVGEGSAADDFGRLEDYEASNPEAMENEYSASGLSTRVEEYEPRTPRNTGERDGKMDAMAATPARSASLHDQLRGHWALADIDETVRGPGDVIISYLDDDGWLRTPLATIAERSNAAYTEAELENALTAVQLFLEPAGVAARTPAECLLLQLDALEDEAEDIGWPRETFANARTIVADHLDDLMQNRLPKVAEKTGLTLEQIKESLLLLRRLSLSPGRRLVDDAARPIVPDAIVEYDPDGDRYIAYLNDRRLPNVQINREYALLAKDRAMEKRDREFIKTNLSNAQWLIDAVNQRRHTLLRVIEAVVEAQRDFFDYGPQSLRPLPMTQVAEQLGIHVATVSRAVSDKHLATPRGIVPLRKFFSGGLQTEGGEEVAWDAIKVALKDVIETEDKAKPLSDEALVDELKKRGIEIARRTVAKYRDQLNIPAARLRRTF